MKRILIFLALLFGLVSIGLAMYGRGTKPEASSQSRAGIEERHALSLPNSRGTYTF